MNENRYFIYDGDVAGFNYRSKEIRRLAKSIYKEKVENDDPLVSETFKEEAEYGIYFKDIKVIHNPENKYDANAIEIYSGDIFIGYVPKLLNKKVLTEMRENNDKVIHFEACYVKENEDDEFLDDYNEPERVNLVIYYDY